MVFHVEKTLKTTIQKKLRKRREFARKISVAEFRYSQTSFLWFTVTLFHSNLNEKITSNEQKLTCNEQKLTSNEQKVTSNKQRATRKNERATSNEQKVQPLSLQASLHKAFFKSRYGKRL